jgi:hypothetical protein
VPAGDVANNYQTPMITPWSTNPDSTADRPYVFRGCFLDPFQGPVAVNFAMAQFKAKKSAVLYALANDYSKGLAEIFKSDWEKNLTQFISKRKQIRLFIHLIDARHPDLEIDRSVTQYLEQIADESQYILPVFTKIDKLNQKEIGALKKRFPDSLMISNLKKRGIDKLISVIYGILNGEV